VMYILDTDVVTLLHADNQAIIRRLRAHLIDEVAIAVITRIEVLRGRFDRLLKAATDEGFLQAQQLLRSSEMKLDKLRTIYLDELALQNFRKLEAEKGLKKIGRADLLIASIVLAQPAILVTRNSKHFRMIPQLRIENWVD
jgi:tRNA(fMet)-specific endonuclease VapC